MATTQKYPPSDKAIDRAEAIIGTSPRKAVYEMAYDLAHAALKAAHDPALGLDRSVCLRDVVEALEELHALRAETGHTSASGASAIADQFGA